RNRIVDTCILQPHNDTASGKIETSAKPKIHVDVDESRVVDEALSLFDGGRKFFQRGGKLVHIVRDAQAPKGLKRLSDAPRITPLQPARLKELLASSAVWTITDAFGRRRPCHPPGWVIDAILSRGQWRNISRLEAVTEQPVIRPDGSVVRMPGYD